jgi:hypothetical protein
MKVVSLSLVGLSSVAAFAPSMHTFNPCSTSSVRHSSQLHLFGGGGGSKKDGEKKGPGMMDQLAMFKKAQEMAQKKKKLDDELAAMEFTGTAADGKVTGTFKFIPITNPMDPNPDYEATRFDFDDEWYASASPEDLSVAVKECIEKGIEQTNEAVTKKYETLQGDLMEAFGGAAGGSGAPPS